MAHSHGDTHGHSTHETIVERDGYGFGPGAIIVLATLLLLAVLGIALLVSQPWDDDGADTTPGIGDNSGGGGAGDGGTGDGGTGEGGTGDGGTGGGGGTGGEGTGGQ